MSCLYFLEALGAQQVWMIPACTHPFGKFLTPFPQRFDMCERLAAAFDGRVVVMRLEEELGGCGQTYYTVVHLQQHYPQHQFVLAIGADILPETPRWYRWPQITARVPVVVVGRHGFAAQGAPLELPALASSQVRALCQRGASLLGLVPQRVVEYIEAHQLYR